MSAVTVLADPSLDAVLAPVLASLPDSFVPAVDDGAPGVVVVDGYRDDWPALLKEALGSARGVLLREPCSPSGPDPVLTQGVLLELARRATSTGVPVVVDRRWSGAPGVDAFAEAFRGEVASATSVTVLLVESGARRTVQDSRLDALGLAHAAGVVVGHLDHVHLRDASWSAWGRSAHGAVLHLQGVHSAGGTGGAVLTATSARTSARLRLTSPTSAAPALASCADPAGERSLPTDFEPAARAAWRRLHERLQSEHLEHGSELEVLAADVVTAHAAVRAGP